MTAQPSSQAEREDVAREVLAEEAERDGLEGRAEWLRVGCPIRADEWPSDDETERVEVAGRVAAMLAFSDREHATPRSMPEEVVEAYERAAKVAECAFDDRPRNRCGHPSQMDWEDGYSDGARAAAAAIRALIPGVSA